MISRRTLLGAIAGAPLASVVPHTAFAAYPDRPVRVIVPFAAGGNADFVARLAARTEPGARAALRGRVPHWRWRQPRCRDGGTRRP